jgi:hypothetical protein
VELGLGLGRGHGVTGAYWGVEVGRRFEQSFVGWSVVVSLEEANAEE